MSFSKDRVVIQISPELRKKLKYLKVKYDCLSYDELFRILLKEKGYWDDEED